MVSTTLRGSSSRPSASSRASDAARTLMNLEPRPTALFAINDNTAIGALSALQTLGLEVPGDVSLVGYNDILIVSRLSTPLTSVRVPFDQIAAAALDLLAGATGPGDRGDRPLRTVPPTLIPRRSTASPRPVVGSDITR
ncbi:substrate-binding domain-containing protein [Streptomyces sp. B6B3]|uniref:substrate-binding domain-containing protein n=1 Tax=Streptomyces sp. B6B3 TaxID=3153570 RepID=UPI00325D15D8